MNRYTAGRSADPDDWRDENYITRLVLKHRMPEYFSYSTSRGGTKPELGIFAQKLVE
jgi:hypothetical protein